MRVPNISVPPGLQEAFFKAMRFLVGDAPPDSQIIVLSNPRLSYLKNKQLYHTQLMTYLGTVWQTLDHPTRQLWQNFWGTLPFGSHGGHNYYPGSGFSAFLYVNGPRARQGLPLILIPESGNIVRNPTFTPGADQWNNIGGHFSGAKWYSVASTNCQIYQNGNFNSGGELAAGNYSLSIYVGPGSGKVHVGFITADEEFPGYDAVFDAGAGNVGFDFSVPSIQDVATFYVQAGPFDSAAPSFDGYVSAPSLTKIG